MQKAEPGARVATRPDRASPLPLLCDSNSVVDHETYRAGGANGAREALARRSATSGGLDGKKFVVWVVSGRLLYEYPAWEKIEVAAGPPPS